MEIRLFTGVWMMVCITITVLALTGRASIEEDEKECADQMVELASCIPFVSGTAKQPTKECCDDTNKLRTAKPKCLCVLIKDSTDPSIGLPINTTLALQMPAACKIDAKVSDCPSLLNLPADSPDAKIFKLASADSSTSTTSSTTPSPSDHSTTSPASSSDINTKTITANTVPPKTTTATTTFLVIAGLASTSFIFL